MSAASLLPHPGPIPQPALQPASTSSAALGPCDQARQGALWVWNGLPSRYAHPAWWRPLGAAPRPAAGSAGELVLSRWLLQQHLQNPLGEPVSESAPAAQPELPSWLWAEETVLLTLARRLGLAAGARSLARLLGREPRLVLLEALGEQGWEDAMSLHKRCPELAGLLAMPASAEALRAALQTPQLLGYGRAVLDRLLAGTNADTAAAVEPARRRLRLRFAPDLPQAPELPAQLSARLRRELQGLLEEALEGTAMAACFAWQLPRWPARPATDG